MRLHFRSLHIPSDWLWVQAQTPVIRAEDTAGVVAQDIITGDIVGAAVFDNWSARSAQAHFMIKSPMVLRHGFLQMALDYVFNKVGVNTLLGFVVGTNLKAIKFNERMGFKVVHTIDNGYAEGVDYVIMQMNKYECRLLPEITEGFNNGR